MPGKIIIPNELLDELNPNIRSIIESLSNDEIDVMLAISKTKIMRKDSFRENTILKNLTDKKRNINVHDVCRSLRNKRIFRLYRAPNNWSFTSIGLRIAEFFKALRARRTMEDYGLTKILRRGIILE